MRKFKCILKRADEPIGHMTWVSDTLRNLQIYVGGYIETVGVGEVIVICDEEGRLKGKPYNCTVRGISFVGDIIVCGSDIVNGNFDDIPITLKDWKERYLNK